MGVGSSSVGREDRRVKMDAETKACMWCYAGKLLSMIGAGVLLYQGYKLIAKRMK